MIITTIDRSNAFLLGGFLYEIFQKYAIIFVEENKAYDCF